MDGVQRWALKSDKLQVKLMQFNFHAHVDSQAELQQKNNTQTTNFPRTRYELRVFLFFLRQRCFSCAYPLRRINNKQKSCFVHQFDAERELSFISWLHNFDEAWIVLLTLSSFCQRLNWVALFCRRSWMKSTKNSSSRKKSEEWKRQKLIELIRLYRPFASLLFTGCHAVNCINNNGHAAGKVWGKTLFYETLLKPLESTMQQPGKFFVFFPKNLAWTDLDQRRSPQNPESFFIHSWKWLRYGLGRITSLKAI